MLCNSQDYREKIIGNSLVKKNNKTYGIPQGSPISDVLANIYMLDFDREMAKIAHAKKAYYRRYSDDILLICDVDDVVEIEALCHSIVKQQGNGELIFGLDKTTKTFFKANDSNSLYCHGDEFSYLGFSFDGQVARYRNSTLSRYKRNIVYGIKSFVRRAHCRAIKNDSTNITQYINYGQLFNKLYYSNKNSEDREITFMTYHERAKKVFNSSVHSQYYLSDSQLKNIKKFIHEKVKHYALKYSKSSTHSHN